MPAADEDSAGYKIVATNGKRVHVYDLSRVAALLGLLGALLGVAGGVSFVTWRLALPEVDERIERKDAPIIKKLDEVAAEARTHMTRDEITTALRELQRHGDLGRDEIRQDIRDLRAEVRAMQRLGGGP